MQKSSLLILIPSLDGGGAERVIILLANNLDTSRFNITIATVYPPTELDISNLLDANIKVHNLNKRKVSLAVPQIYRFIRSRNPDIVLSTLPAMNLWLSLMIPFLARRIRFIARESSIPSVRVKFTHPLIYNTLYRYGFNKFDRIICLSEIMKNDLVQNFRVDADKISIIWNFVDWPLIEAKITDSKETPYKFDIISIGGLSKVKNHKLLIEAARYLPKRIKIGILGEGFQRNELEEMIERYKLEDNVKLLGFQENPFPYLRSAKLYAHTSLYEAGSPNAVIEGLVMGLPVVALDSHGGVKEILELEINGFLCQENKGEEFAELLMKVLEKDFNREQLQKDAIEKFNKPKSMAEYQKVLLGD